ncbi:NERD domain-containing protein [Candidatus Leptofilum sp.]|uniref:NERD domain-containing protein n=1 Tax=Candidatus Leptofilum sp. TaxID=3241576 RepID=UPI003B5A13FB
MMRFEEGWLAFVFDSEWRESVIKFDEHRDYKKVANSLTGTKGVDFLGILDSELCIIEVKDFRGYRIENKHRIANGDLLIEIGQKIRDTVACIVGSSRSSSNFELWQRYCDLLLDREKKISVILWLEEDKPPKRKDQVSQNVLRNKLKQKLKWLAVKVDVRNLGEVIPPRLHLQVASLPMSSSNH